MNSPDFTDLLGSILMSIREDIAPDLRTAQARHRLSLVDMMLVRMIVELENKSGEEAIAGMGVEPACADALHKQTADPRGATREELEKVIAEFAAAETARRSRIEQLMEQTAASASIGERSSDELSIPAEVFTGILRKQYPLDAGIEATGVTIVPGGRSKGTILVETNGSTGISSVVIRRDFSASVTGVSVVYEYPIIQALWNAGVPVPQPLWLEKDTSIIGGAYIAFARVPGQAMGTLFSSDASADFTRQFAAALAQVHSLEIDKAGIAANLNWGGAGHPVRTMVDNFYQRYCDRVTRIPLLDTAFAWLYLQIERIGCERALVHGDAGLHNAMGQGDTLTGLLDWEFAHAGDPAEDLCYCKHLVETILPWAQFMDAYKAAGGQDISAQRMRFFSIWRTVQLAIQMGGARTMYESGVDRDLRIAAIAYNSYPRILNDLAADLAAFSSE
jgi:aminoglycoside phosphotransferase (APT) family kinase protein